MDRYYKRSYFPPVELKQSGVETLHTMLNGGGAEYQQLLQLAKEERKGIVNEEREALERDYQQQIETHLARLATINLRRQFEEEELRREAE
ncbi:hypothetical protein MMC15_002281 [Xylographa vitiligo]|nr:hypothetical protein [Xylographa vitiligo]